MSLCPVCDDGGTQFFATAWDAEYCTTTERFTYVRCPRCETIFLDPPPVDRLAEIYPKNYYSYSGDGTSMAHRIKKRLDGRIFRRLIAEISGERLAVLDVGGGTGWLLTLIREQNSRVTETHELDIDESARPAAEAAGHVFHCQRVEDFTSERRFDLVVLLNLIEHVADPARVLRSMQRLLSDDGCILIKTPNTDTLDRRIFKNHNWGGFHCPRHWVLFTRRGFVELAQRCGLRCVSARYTQGAPQWTFSILSVLASRRLIKCGPDRPLYTHPLHGPLLALMATFDFLRLPFVPTAQMFVVLKRDGNHDG